MDSKLISRLALSLVLLGLLTSLTACGGDSPVDVKQQIIGKWTTTSPTRITAYADVEFTTNKVIGREGDNTATYSSIWTDWQPNQHQLANQVVHLQRGHQG